MPAFSCVFRHHLPALEILRSHLSSRYRSFRHLLSGHSGPDSVPSDSESGHGYLTPDSSLESLQKSKKQGKFLPSLHSRLGQLDTLRTYIRGGHKSETTEEGIYVTRDIEQDWRCKSTMTQEKPWGRHRTQHGKQGRNTKVVEWRWWYGGIHVWLKRCCFLIPSPFCFALFLIANQSIHESISLKQKSIPHQFLRCESSSSQTKFSRTHVVCDALHLWSLSSSCQVVEVSMYLRVAWI